MFILIPLVESNIIKRSLEFINRSLNAATKSLDLTNKPLNHYFMPLLYTKVCLPLENVSRTPHRSPSASWSQLAQRE